jgi:peroxiredoxin Q/BCP
MARLTSLLPTLTAAVFAFAAASQGADLAIGNPAPEFELMGSDGKVHRLSDHAGKRGVVLAWFPKAFTPG